MCDLLAAITAITTANFVLKLKFPAYEIEFKENIKSAWIVHPSFYTFRIVIPLLNDNLIYRYNFIDLAFHWLNTLNE